MGVGSRARRRFDECVTVLAVVLHHRVIRGRRVEHGASEEGKHLHTQEAFVSKGGVE